MEVKFDNNSNKLINSGANIVFMCPKCGKEEICRTEYSRKQGESYTCSKCEFVGP